MNLVFWSCHIIQQEFQNQCTSQPVSYTHLYLKAHSFTLALTEAVSSCNVRISIHLTGIPYAAPLSCLWIIFIKNILHSKTGTCRTDKIAATTANTAAAIFLPHRILMNYIWKILRDLYMNLILFHKIQFLLCILSIIP